MYDERGRKYNARDLVEKILEKRNFPNNYDIDKFIEPKFSDFRNHRKNNRNS